MKKLTIIAGTAFAIAILSASVKAQSMAFRQGSFEINVTEGNTYSNYTSNGLSTSVGEGHTIGCRDPFQIEYGLTNRWGIGISSGADLYTFNGVSGGQVHTVTSEFTIDGSYHFFVTKKIDVAAVASYGGSSIDFKGGTGDNSYSYATKGDIGRIGLHGRFFVLGHFGLVAMVTAFSETGVQQVASGYTGPRYSSSFWGIAKEFGICYRIKK
jgi:hypothetical protein